MKKIIAKPYLFFFGLIPIVLILGFIKREESIDINVSYIYYVVGLNTLSYFFAVFFGLIGLNYFSLLWANKKPKKWLTIFHLLLQSIALLLFFTKNNWNWLGKSELNYSFDYSNFILILSLVIFIISTFIHLINFFVSLFLKRE